METVNSGRLSASKRELPVQSGMDPHTDLTYLIKKYELINSHPTTINNYSNFAKSGLPRRIMFYSKEEWKDFPDSITPLLLEAFKDRRSEAEVSMCSNNYHLDFLLMVMINFESGALQSVAWIDELDVCFFPEHLFDVVNVHKENDNTKVKLEIEVKEGDHLKYKDSNEVSPKEIDVKYETKEVILESGVPCLNAPPPNALGFESLGENMVVKLDKNGEAYLDVKCAFLKGLCNFVNDLEIIGIYQYSPSSHSTLARLQSFEKRIETTKSNRGDANVRRAWHGSSAEGIVGILCHGFGMNRRILSGVAYGSDIYFAPEDCSHISAKYSDIDENGVQHMVFCRIIMGHMEQVQPGSKQYRPSSEAFDSGVDDLQNPKHYVVWSAHFNTHVHPEFVVSFKVAPSVREYFAGLKCKLKKIYEVKKNVLSFVDHVEKLPTSSSTPFPMLFATLQNNISPQMKILLESHFNDFESNLITRQELIRRLRLIVGDKQLTTTLNRHHIEPPVITETPGLKRKQGDRE